MGIPIRLHSPTQHTHALGTQSQSSCFVPPTLLPPTRDANSPNHPNTDPRHPGAHLGCSQRPRRPHHPRPPLRRDRHHPRRRAGIRHRRRRLRHRPSPHHPAPHATRPAPRARPAGIPPRPRRQGKQPALRLAALHRPAPAPPSAGQTGARPAPHAPPPTASRPRASGLRRSGRVPPAHAGRTRGRGAPPPSRPHHRLYLHGPRHRARSLRRGFWSQVEKTLRRYGGSLSRLYQVARAARRSLPARTRQKPGHPGTSTGRTCVHQPCAARSAASSAKRRRTASVRQSSSRADAARTQPPLSPSQRSRAPRSRAVARMGNA